MAAYKITFDDNEETHYLVQSRGKEGYSGGTVTCWVAVNIDADQNKILNIAKVQVGESSGQTFMDKITDKMLSDFTKDLPDGGFYPDGGYVSSGATLSSTAICNAVNGAVDYVNDALGNATQNAYENFRFTEYINTARTTHSVDGANVTYDIYTNGYGYASAFHISVTVGANATITSYQIPQNGNGSTHDYDQNQPADIKDGSLFVGKTLEFFTAIYGENMTYTAYSGSVSTGATASNSNYLCMYAAAFATANYAECINGGNA